MDNDAFVKRNFVLEGTLSTPRWEMSRTFQQMAINLLRELHGCYALEAVLQRLNYVRQHTLGELEQWEQRFQCRVKTERVIPEPTTAVMAAQLPRNEAQELSERRVPRWADETTKVITELEREKFPLIEVDIPQVDNQRDDFHESLVDGVHAHFAKTRDEEVVFIEEDNQQEVLGRDEKS